MDIELTDEEREAIEDLKCAASMLPDSLWLFGGAGVLYVMRYGEDGHPVMKNERGAGYDADYAVGEIPVPGGVDGGDW